MKKIYYNRKHFRGKDGGLTESVFFMPFEKSEHYQEPPVNGGRFDQVIQFGAQHVQCSPIDQCDYVILPYKWEGRSPSTDELIRQAGDAGKEIIVIYNDDDDSPMNLADGEGHIFRTSFNRSTAQSNEHAFPAFCADYYPTHSRILISKEEQMSMGFCGQAFIPVRRKTIQQARKVVGFKKDFVLRKGFWAPEIADRMQAREEFLTNLADNLFIFCIRGAGNFSYRFYETMMMGRIPIIIDTDQVFPFEKGINYSETCIIIPEKNINQMEEIIFAWLSGKDELYLVDIQNRNRNLWLEFLSPMGWLSKFYLEFEETI